MLKIGVLGVGHLGKIHLKLIQEIDGLELVGFYDPDAAAVKEGLTLHSHLKAFDSVDALIDAVDVVDIVSTTHAHHECAVKAFKQSKHIFIEKPMTNTLEQARELMQLYEEANVKVQVGHVERYNPALIAAKKNGLAPMFIEAHRMAPFNPRGTDVSVVFDLMIHDIDIALHLVNSNVKNIQASGVAVVSDRTDIANARLEFDNGCVANLTGSRVSVKKMRKMRLFQKNAYYSVDFANQQTKLFTLEDVDANKAETPYVLQMNGRQKKAIHLHKLTIEPINAIKTELTRFANAILNDTEPDVPFMDGYKALLVAHQILKKIEKNPVYKQ